MHAAVFYLAITWLALLLGVVVVLLLRGRSPASRVLASDALTLLLVAILALLARWTQRDYYLDVALALALLSFVGTLVVSRYRSGERLFP